MRGAARLRRRPLGEVRVLKPASGSGTVVQGVLTERPTTRVYSAHNPCEEWATLLLRTDELAQVLVRWHAEGGESGEVWFTLRDAARLTVFGHRIEVFALAWKDDAKVDVVAAPAVGPVPAQLTLDLGRRTASADLEVPPFASRVFIRPSNDAGEYVAQLVQGVTSLATYATSAFYGDTPGEGAVLGSADTIDLDLSSSAEVRVAFGIDF